jgi:hypothetical protein
MINIGDKVLVTTDHWFFAPNGESYSAAHGTLKGIFSDVETLGIRTNAKRTNWYVEIGNMLIAGCQIHYAVKCDSVDFEKGSSTESWHEGRIASGHWQHSRIHNADQ